VGATIGHDGSPLCSASGSGFGEYGGTYGDQASGDSPNSPLKDSFRCRSSDQILFETAPQLSDLALFTQAKAQVHAVQFRAAGPTEHKQSARVVVRG
jgi:hypothetical protein